MWQMKNLSSVLLDSKLSIVLKPTRLCGTDIYLFRELGAKRKTLEIVTLLICRFFIRVASADSVVLFWGVEEWES